MNKKKEMGNEVTANEIKSEIKAQTKYWHKCSHCSCQQSTKTKKLSYWVEK